jgi:hypothetical protein
MAPRPLYAEPTAVIWSDTRVTTPADVDVQFAPPFRLETVEPRLDDDMKCASPGSARGFGTFARGDPAPPPATAAVDRP